MSGGQPNGELTIKQRAFLAAYKHCLQISRAARAAGCSLATHYNWLEHENYRAAFYEAHEDVAATVLSEVIRRSIDGTKKLVVYKGEPVFVWVDENRDVIPEELASQYNEIQPGSAKLIALEETTFSDQLLLALAKAAMPEKFKERSEQKIDASISNADGPSLYQIYKLPIRESDNITNANLSSAGTTGNLLGQ